jgi:hypothetical protein
MAQGLGPEFKLQFHKKEKKRKKRKRVGWNQCRILLGEVICILNKSKDI